LPHDLEAKDFHSGRDTFGLRHDLNIYNDRSIRRGPVRCSRKDKESNFSF
jgi:hypothetical protein